MLYFRYKSIPLNDGEKPSKLPIIPLTIQTEKGLIKFNFLLDSGSNITAIPVKLAEFLSLPKIKELKPAEGIGGKVKTWQSKFDYFIEYPKFEKKVYSMECSIIDSDFRLPLLGRLPFFERFKILFNERAETVELKPLDNQTKKLFQ